MSILLGLTNRIAKHVIEPKDNKKNKKLVILWFIGINISRVVSK